MVTEFQIEVPATFLVVLGACVKILFSSKWRFLCWLKGHIVPLPLLLFLPQQSYWLLSLEWFSFFEHIVISSISYKHVTFWYPFLKPLHYTLLGNRCSNKKSNWRRVVFLTGRPCKFNIPIGELMKVPCSMEHNQNFKSYSPLESYRVLFLHWLRRGWDHCWYRIVFLLNHLGIYNENHTFVYKDNVRVFDGFLLPKTWYN